MTKYDLAPDDRINNHNHKVIHQNSISLCVKQEKSHSLHHEMLLIKCKLTHTVTHCSIGYRFLPKATQSTHRNDIDGRIKKNEHIAIVMSIFYNLLLHGACSLLVVTAVNILTTSPKQMIKRNKLIQQQQQMLHEKWIDWFKSDTMCECEGPY